MPLYYKPIKICLSKIILAWIILALGWHLIEVLSPVGASINPRQGEVGFVFLSNSTTPGEPKNFTFLRTTPGLVPARSYKMSVLWVEKEMYASFPHTNRIGHRLETWVRVDYSDTGFDAEDSTEIFRSLRSYLSESINQQGLVPNRMPKDVLSSIENFDGVVSQPRQLISISETSASVLFARTWYPPLLTLMLVLFASWYSLRVFREFKRSSSIHQCARCGYSLDGLSNNRCPECGKVQFRE